METKRKTKRVPATLLELSTKRDARRSSDETEGGDNECHEELQQKNSNLQDQIQELHQKAEAKLSSKELRNDTPPVLHICVQFCPEVVQTRFEKSFFSSIIHEADNIVDKITGDEDDSDFESLFEVEDSSGVMDDLGFGPSKPMPELRILVNKVTEANKIICPDETTNGKVTVTYQSGSKRLHEKTKKRKINHRHTIGFNHVFNFRGPSIKHWVDTDIKIGVKMYSENAREEAYAILSATRCVMEDRVHPPIEDHFITDPQFWRDYLDKHSEELYSFSIPLICSNRPAMIKLHSSHGSYSDLTLKAERSPAKHEQHHLSVVDTFKGFLSPSPIRRRRSPSPMRRKSESIASTVPSCSSGERSPTLSQRSNSSPLPSRTKILPPERSSSSDSLSSKEDRGKRKKFNVKKIKKFFT